MGISIQSEGRRHYVIGDTYPIRNRLRDAGGHWDGERQAWWFGKKDAAESIVAAASQGQGAERKDESVSTSDRVIRGRAQYEGKTYYLLAEGTSANTGRPYAKLCFRDGSKVFWAKDPALVRVVKHYQEPTSIDALRRFAEKRKALDAGKAGIRYECDECGEWVTSGDGTRCWETGCAH